MLLYWLRWQCLTASISAGLAQEGEHIATLNGEVQAAEHMCSIMPAEVQGIKDGLDRDSHDLRRREAGGLSVAWLLHKTYSNCSLPGSMHVQTGQLNVHVMPATALANQESIQESKLRAMRQAVDLYRGRLGLEFRKGVVQMWTDPYTDSVNQPTYTCNDDAALILSLIFLSLPRGHL